MTIKSSQYKELNVSANALLLQVSLETAIDPVEALHLTTALIEKRKLLDQIIKTHLFPSHSDDFYDLTTEATEKLNKAQSRLIKRLNPSPVFTQSFTKRVEKIWMHATGQELPFSDFGYLYSVSNRSDPFVLEALHEHLRIEALQDFRSAYKNRDKDNAKQLLTRLHPTDLSYIENEAIKRLRNKNTKFSSGNEMLLFNMQGQWDPLFVDIIDSYISSQKVTDHIPTFPIVHQTLTSEEHDFLTSVCMAKKFIIKMHKKLKERDPRTIIDIETIRDLLYRNIKHPIVLEVAAAIATEDELIPLKKAIKAQDGIAISGILSQLSSHTKKILEEKYLLLKQTDRTSPSAISFLNQLNFNGKCNLSALKIIDMAIAHFTDIELEKREAALKEPISGLNDPYIGIMTVFNPQDAFLEEFRPNLKRAFAAIEFTVRKLAISTNFLNHEEKILDFRSSNYANVEEFRYTLNQWREIHLQRAVKYLKDKGLPKTPFFIAIAAAKSALVYPIGNCGEMSRLAFSFLSRNNDADQLIERYSIAGKNDTIDADHLFVVIGRDPFSNPRDPRTWGAKAVVCDPWARKAYPAWLIPSILQDYTDVDRKGFPELKPFNPKTQYLEVSAENFPMKRDYKISKNKTDKHILSQLKQFHMADSQLTRKKIAGQILEFLETLNDKQNKLPYIKLKAQMHFYLHNKLPSIPKVNFPTSPVLNNSPNESNDPDFDIVFTI